MRTSFFIILGLCIFTSGCSSSQTLEFTTLAESASFQLTSAYGGNLPPLIVIASTNELTSPVGGAEFRPAILEQLQQVDFSQYFVVIHQVGRLKDNARITRISRSGDKVHIVVNQYSVGPGNYELPGSSMPFAIALVAKGKQDWDGEITFTIELDSGEVIYAPLHKELSS